MKGRDVREKGRCTPAGGGGRFRGNSKINKNKKGDEI